MEVFQTQFELDQMVNICRLQQPQRILEIGAWDGGTLVRWLEVADTVVVVDDRMRRTDEWLEKAREEEAALFLLEGDSRDPAIVERAAELAPFDWLFIDADHTYPSVKADFDNYSPLAAVVAFHDIFERPDYGVSRLWQELKSRVGARWVEIGETMNPQVHGIGVLWT